MEFDLRTDDLSATDLEDNFDFDYSVGEVFIDSMEMFRRELMEHLHTGDKYLADAVIEVKIVLQIRCG